MNQNVVVNYFVHHYLALQFAKTAGETEESGKEDLRRALVYEARAQSYLRNAFYAGHMLVPIYYPLFALHSRNIREAHDFYRNTGVFVINARGDAWQTFGGAILQTHEPTYRYILEASLTSLRELFLVYYTSISDGTIPKYLISDEMPLERLKKRVIETWTADGYYRQIFFGYYASIGNGTVLKRFIPEDTPVEKIRETIKKWTSIEKIENYYSNDTGGMPTLLLLPMPISATWSERLPEKDDHDIHRRFHYPQLRDEELHDPSLKNKPLYAKKDVPQWLIPMQLTDKDADYLIKMHPNCCLCPLYAGQEFPAELQGTTTPLRISIF